MNSITENLNHIHSSIYSAVTNSKREENSVKLLCVSKTKPKEMVIEAYNDGERHFGESYAVEASEKIEQLKEQLASAQVLFFYCSFLYIEKI